MPWASSVKLCSARQGPQQQGTCNITPAVHTHQVPACLQSWVHLLLNHPRPVDQDNNHITLPRMPRCYRHAWLVGTNGGMIADLPVQDVLSMTDAPKHKLLHTIQPCSPTSLCRSASQPANLKPASKQYPPSHHRAGASYRYHFMHRRTANTGITLPAAPSSKVHVHLPLRSEYDCRRVDYLGSLSATQQSATRNCTSEATVSTCRLIRARSPSKPNLCVAFHIAKENIQ